MASFWRDIEVDISANATNGASDSFALGPHGGIGKPFVPTSIKCPSNLQNVDRLKIQVSYDDDTFHDIYDEEGSIPSIALVASGVMVVPSIIQVGTIGFPYVRLLTCNASDVAEEPADDITFRVHFSEGEV